MRDKRALIGKWISVALAGIALASGLCRPAHGSDRQTGADVRCVVVGMRMIEMATTQQRGAGMMLAVYYFGRLDGYTSRTDIDSLIEREARKMTVAEFRANATRCGKALTAKGQEIAKIGENLSKSPSR